MQTIMDPREVRRFAQDLKERCNELGRLNGQTSAASLTVRETWKDSKYDSFVKLLDEAALEIRKFCDYGDRYAEHLNRKAGGVERYLDERY